MRFFDWLWCVLNGYCTTHIEQTMPFGGHCRSCIAEREAAIKERQLQRRRERLQYKVRQSWNSSKEK